MPLAAKKDTHFSDDNDDIENAAPTRWLCVFGLGYFLLLACYFPAIAFLLFAVEPTCTGTLRTWGWLYLGLFTGISLKILSACFPRSEALKKFLLHEGILVVLLVLTVIWGVAGLWFYDESSSCGVLYWMNFGFYVYPGASYVTIMLIYGCCYLIRRIKKKPKEKLQKEASSSREMLLMPNVITM